MVRSLVILIMCAVLTTGCGSGKPPSPPGWDEAFGDVPEESINKNLDKIQHNMKQAR